MIKLHIFKFEWVRFKRKNYFLVLILLALFCSGLNFAIWNSSLNSYASNDTYLREVTKQLFYRVMESTYNTDFSSSPEYSKIQMDLLNELEPYVDEFGNIFQRERTDYPFISLMEEAVEELAIDLNSQEQSDLTYILGASYHKQVQQENDEQYTSEGWVDLLIKDHGIVFGWVPLLILFIFSLIIYSEEFERGMVFFQQTLPNSQIKLYLIRVIGLLSLAMAYIFLVLLWHFLFGIAFQMPFGDIFYPHQIIENDATITTIAIFWKRLLIFIAKASLFINFGFLLGHFIRRVVPSLICGMFIFLLTSFFTFFSSKLHFLLNPFYMDDYFQIVGKRGTHFLQVNFFNFWEDLQPSIPGQSISKFLVVYLTIILIISGVIYLIYRYQINISIIKVNKFQINHLARKSSFKNRISFEYQKLSLLFNRYILYGIIASIVVLFVILMVFQDKQAYSRMINNQAIENYQSMVNSAKEVNEQIEALDNHKRIVYEAVYKQNQQSIEQFGQQVEDLQMRHKAMEQMLSEPYYQSFDFDLLIHFDPAETTILFQVGDNPYEFGDTPSNFSYQISKERLDLLSDAQIRPLINTHIKVTPYDQLKNATDNSLQKIKNQIADQSFLGLTYRMIYYYRLDIVLMLIIIIMAGSGYNLEFETGKHLDFLYTLPISKKQILNEKIIAATLKIISISAVFLISNLVLGLFLMGVGDPDIPVIHYLTWEENAQNGSDFTQSYQWQTLGEVLFQTFSLLFVASFFSILLLYFISVHIKGYTKSLLVFSMIIVLGVGLSLIAPSLGQWLPFVHLNISTIISGEFWLQSPIQLTYLKSIFILIGWSGLFYLLIRYRLPKIDN